MSVNGTLEEKLKDVRHGDWLRVRYPDSTEVFAEVFSPKDSRGVRLSTPFGCFVLRDYTDQGCPEIVEHVKVMDQPWDTKVVYRGDWDRHEWPEGVTILATATNTYAVSVDGSLPVYGVGTPLADDQWPVTVERLPRNVYPEISTREGIAKIKNHSIIVDAVGDVLRRVGDTWRLGNEIVSEDYIARPVRLLQDGDEK